MDKQVATCQMLIVLCLLLEYFLQVNVLTGTVLTSRHIFVVLEVLCVYHVLCTIQQAPFK